ncbi:hypothetical protein N836_27755 [Leptolyngbya sp. Heron Island J]|uniref:hypothetical protein n=1 Tax=Leptolyngbya sp. Heron Island J TaxID=1385935 RepID=UPI0003B9DE99|nr:hypothetical protein [Leptolyngbya sp. Heron Island J]ESA32389.1 hypothetical protein N836_27755 [Leptolyngbya sp. Heron Island J]
MDIMDISESVDSVPEDEWDWNIISKRAVVYACGTICRDGDVVEHNHHPTEFGLCQRLSQEAAEIMDGIYINMGDESDHHFSSFYIVANSGSNSPAEITEDLMRSAFGGTIHHTAKITVEPLDGIVSWVEDNSNVDYGEDDQDKVYRQSEDRYVKAWQALEKWFGETPELQAPVFVSVDERGDDDDESMVGSVFPRLVLALTKNGSLVGLFSCIVCT